MCKTTLKAHKLLGKWQFWHARGRHMAEFRPMVWFLKLKISDIYATDFTRRVWHISQQNMTDFVVIPVAFH